MSNQIIFNGKVYQSAEDMPPQIRQAYQAVMGVFGDKDKDGLPDILENTGTASETGQINIYFEGQVYHSLEELPPEARLKYQEAMGKLDKDGNGLPDFVEHLAGGFAGMTSSAETAISAREPDFHSAAPVSDHPPVMETVGVNWKMLLLSVVIIGIACFVALVVWGLVSR